jgi:hypothetical protein
VHFIRHVGLHYFAHLKARALRLPRWYLGVAFDEQVITARGRRTIGAMTRVSRRDQQFDADGRGSDVVIVARSENGGLVPGRLLGAILLLRGAPVGGRSYGVAEHISRSEPLLRTTLSPKGSIVI